MHRHNTDITSLLVASAEQAEFFFRIGMEASGNDKFTEFIELLLKFVNKHPTGKLNELNAILTSMVLAQERKDWIALADIIKYVFFVYLTDYE